MSARTAVVLSKKAVHNPDRMVAHPNNPRMRKPVLLTAMLALMVALLVLRWLTAEAPRQGAPSPKGVDSREGAAPKLSEAGASKPATAADLSTQLPGIWVLEVDERHFLTWSITVPEEEHDSGKMVFFVHFRDGEKLTGGLGYEGSLVVNAEAGMGGFTFSGVAQSSELNCVKKSSIDATGTLSRDADRGVPVIEMTTCRLEHVYDCRATVPRKFLIGAERSCSEFHGYNCGPKGGTRTEDCSGRWGKFN